MFLIRFVQIHSKNRCFSPSKDPISAFRQKSTPKKSKMLPKNRLRRIGFFPHFVYNRLKI